MFLSHTLAATEAYTLVSWWKPLLLLVPFVPWAVIVSKVLDKHASRFILPRQMWGSVHLVVATVAVLVALSFPMKSEASFWVGWGIMIVLLVADIVVFAVVTNKDERVPEEFKLTLDMSKWTAKREEKKQAALQGKVELNIKGADKSLVAAPQMGTPEFETRVAAENVFMRALGARAAQVDFAPTGRENVYGVTFQIDGLRTPAVLSEPVQTKDGPPPPPPGVMSGAEAQKVMDFWRAAGKMDLAERRKRQVADISIERGTTRSKVRLTSIGGQTGMRLSMLIDPEMQVRRKVEAMGLLEPQAAALRALVADGKGVVLISSPPDSGRTTLLYTTLKMHDAYTKNVQTLEVDIQDSLEGVRQNVFDPAAEGADFATNLRSILRRDPDVVGAAELPDAATAKEAAKSDKDRCRVYLSFKSENALAAAQTYTKAVADGDLASKSLSGTMSVRLLRKLCTNCRQPYQPSADMLKKLGLPADKVKQLFKKGGQVMVKNKPEICPACGGVGYVGLEGAYEIFPIGDAERAAIKAGDFNALKMEFRKKNLPTIQQAALRKALDGVTSVEEMLRATADEQPKAAAPSAPTAPKPAPVPQKG